MKQIGNTHEMRAFLIEQMIKAAEGKHDPIETKAICNLAQQVYNFTNLEIRYAQAKARLGDTRLEPLAFNGSGESRKAVDDVRGSEGGKKLGRQRTNRT